MEGLGLNTGFWKNRSVFVTGHTGFKGGWLSLWLARLGAKVHGYALEPPTSPSFFNEVQLQGYLAASTIGDIRDLASVSKAMREAKPSVVFHLAAQPLVRASYASPVDAFATNVLGTVNVLESARRTEEVQAIVNVTTDKCYENKEWLWPYRETDGLGGYDPYSSSKACAEIATAAYRKSFLAEAGIHIATARAGNVIGGGDWARDRLIPDFFRALDRGETLRVRSPSAVRPWQHTLEPLSGYLMLAERLISDGAAFAEAWNFGPDESDTKTVGWIAEYLCKKVSARWEQIQILHSHEASLLRLDSSKAKSKLGWAPRWSLRVSLDKTVDWHQAWKEKQLMIEKSINQIDAYYTSATP